MYRYTAPQRGNFREFWQLGRGDRLDDPALDAEVIQVYDELLARLGVTNYELQLNSIGDENCRPQYLERLTQWLDEHDDVLDDEARQKRATSPLRVFDVKSEQVQAALAEAPKIGDALCDPVPRALPAGAGAPRELRDRVHARPDSCAASTTTRGPPRVRGRGDRREEPICGGGRYDGLIEEIGGQPTPGIGFGAGIERLLLARGDRVTAEPEGVDVFVLLLERAITNRGPPARRRAAPSRPERRGRLRGARSRASSRTPAGWARGPSSSGAGAVDRRRPGEPTRRSPPRS
jgi:histidyl-tRNA synthetase